MIKYDVGDILQDLIFPERRYIITDLIRPQLAHIENVAMYEVYSLTDNFKETIYMQTAHKYYKQVA